MTKEEILELAKNYMIARDIEIVLPGEIGEVIGDDVEVIFLDPSVFEPGVVVIPPDNRVYVNIKTKKITPIMQM